MLHQKYLIDLKNKSAENGFAKGAYSCNKC